MKFKKINFIKNFGCFSDFSWDDNLPEFSTYNFIYGWNYSGKTSLSRLLRCIETKKIQEDFSNLEFKIKTDNGEIIKNKIGEDFPIRVLMKILLVKILIGTMKIMKLTQF